MFEVELKAMVGDPVLIGHRLDQLLTYAGEVDKSDEYWSIPLAEPAASGMGFRLRLRAEPGKTTVTFKEKTYDGNVEVNREVEFGILDPGAFRLFLEKMSAKPVYAKTKKGRMWQGKGSLLAELVEVGGLGCFLEVETVCADAEDIDLQGIKASLMMVVEGCGLGESDLEPRPYSQLLGMSGY
jgi:predicted adenylyl cyclase CyaB